MNNHLSKKIRNVHFKPISKGLFNFSLGHGVCGHI